jgi:4-hydroxy-tetrahydrodipicolinate synthase
MTDVFGTVLTAMVTPFTPSGDIDRAATASLASHLVDSGNDGLVVNGTTGEAPTTSDDEKDEVIRIVLEAVGDRAKVIAGVGTNNTSHTVELAQRAEKAGAHGLLVVTPYYNKPPQAGLLQHFRMVADATDLPNMLYDIPGRSVAEISTATLVDLSEHPNILAVKDAKGDLAASARVLAATDLLYYSGEDALNLPLLAVGATGFVSVIGHFVGPELRAMREAFFTGELARAQELHYQSLAPNDAVFATQAAITVKGALARQGLCGPTVRLPLIEATHEQVDAVIAALEAISG